MPIAACGGTQGCDRSISISAVPGGNPAANADPEGYASVWTFCASCKSYTCDRCLAKQQSRCRCGAPARLFTEAERIQIAQGGPPPPAPSAAAAAPAAAPVTSAPPALRLLLEGIGMQIDGDLSRGGLDRARAMGRLAATLMIQQGPDAPATDLGFLMWFGESFYRWQFFAEGAEYWKGVYQLAKKLGKHEGDEGTRALASAAAFQVLSGEVGPSSPQAQNFAGFVLKVFGPSHVLTKDVHAKLGPPPPAASQAGGWPSAQKPAQGGWPSGQQQPAAPPPAAPPAQGGWPAAQPPSSQGGWPAAQPAQGGWPAAQPAQGGWPAAQPTQGAPPAAPPVNLAPAPPQRLPELASLDASSSLALWVTLAFLDIAVADGKIEDKEYLAWKQTMARMRLPDVWDRFGTQGLQRLLQSGALHQLSSEFATLPIDGRAKMAGVLVEFMMADGKAEPQEIQAIKRIGGWLGVSMQIG